MPLRIPFLHQAKPKARPAPAVIRSLPLEGKHFLYYHPEINLLTLDGEMGRRIAPAEDFGDILFRYFLGMRKLTALKEALQPPRTVFVEPWRTCNLACTYCYAESNPSQKKRVDAGQLAALVKKFPFKQVLVFGGEPLVDEHFLPELLSARQWESFFFSTNGLLLDQEFAQKLIRMPNVRFQLSIEPGAWSCRVNAAGKKQIELMGDQLRMLRDARPDFRITIPSDVPHTPIKQFIDSLANAVGGTNFTVSYWPARAPAPVPWLGDWIRESYEVVREDRDEKYRDKLPGCQMASYFREAARKGFRYFNCNAGHGSVAIGPDNKLHCCHELAVVESDVDIVSSSGEAQEIDEAKRLAQVYKWTKGMAGPVCRTCAARFVCGGICFVMDPPHSACGLIADMLQLILTEMVRYNPQEAMDMASRSEEKFVQLSSMRDGLVKEVNSEKWNRLVSGELPLAEAAELARRFLSD